MTRSERDLVLDGEYCSHPINQFLPERIVNVDDSEHAKVAVSSKVAVWQTREWSYHLLPSYHEMSESLPEQQNFLALVDYLHIFQIEICPDTLSYL